MDKNQLPPLPQEMQEAISAPQPQEFEAQPVSPEPQEAPQQETQESDAARNFRALREAKEKAERERDEMLRMITQVQSQKKAAPIEEEDDIHLNPDDLVEWKHVDKKIKKLESQIKNYQSQSAVAVTEARLKSQYPDFDSVVSQQNVAQLSSQYPELANALASTSDLYSQAVSAYTLIKKLGISPEDDTYARDRERAKVNASKPRPLASVSPQQGDSPLSRANAFAQGLTEDLKNQLHKEMVESIRNK